MAKFTQKENLSGSVLAITVFTIVLLLGLAIWCLNGTSDTQRVTALMLIGTLVIVSVCSLMFMPLSLTIEDRVLAINFSFRTRKFDLNDIEKAVAIGSVMHTFRILGSGGFFGYWGWFRKKELGRYFMYATTRQNLVALILKDGRKYVISSPDPEALIAEINKQKK